MPVLEHEEWVPGAWAELRVDVLTRDDETDKYMVRYTNPDGTFVDFEISKAGTAVNLPSGPAPSPPPPEEEPEEPTDPNTEPSN